MVWILFDCGSQSPAPPLPFSNPLIFGLQFESLEFDINKKHPLYLLSIPSHSPFSNKYLSYFSFLFLSKAVFLPFFLFFCYFPSLEIFVLSSSFFYLAISLTKYTIYIFLGGFKSKMYMLQKQREIIYKISTSIINTLSHYILA